MFSIDPSEVVFENFKSLDHTKILGDKRRGWHISSLPIYESVPLDLEILADGGILHHRHHHRATRGRVVLEEMECNQEAPLGLGAQLVWWSWDLRYRSWRLTCLKNGTT